MRHWIEKYLKKHYDMSEALELSLPTPVPTSTVYSWRSGVRGKILLPILFAIPYVCLGVILLYFEERQFALIQKLFSMEEKLWRKNWDMVYTLAIAGLIGYGTNWLAIKMLFHPRQRRPIWGQGLLPANREKIVVQFSRAISNHIINEEAIKNVLHEAGVAYRVTQTLKRGTHSLFSDLEFQTELKQTLVSILRQWIQKPENQKRLLEILDEQLMKALPGGIAGGLVRSYRQLNEKGYKEVLQKAIAGLPQAVEEALAQTQIPDTAIENFLEENTEGMEEILAELLMNLVDKLKIQSVIFRQLSQFDDRKLEELFRQTTSEHLRYIQYMGGFLGMIGGIFIWRPLMTLVAFTVGLSLLALLDVFLFKLYHKRKPLL
ncbi:MAG: DUF445 domain-containing protein [Bacteroidia bacterium]